MKKYRILGMFSAALLLIGGACSDDNLKAVSDGGGKNVNVEDGVYMTFNFELPTAKSTRSYTEDPNMSNTGIEVAKDYENNVTSVAVVLAKKIDYGFIASSVHSEDILESVGTSGRSFKATSTFSKTDLADLYGDEEYTDKDGNGNYEVCVFVFCNPTDELISGYTAKDPNESFKGLENLKYGDTDWINGCGTYTEEKSQGGINAESIWGKDNFLMTNAQISERLLPPSLADWDMYKTTSSAFNLSGINNLGRPNEIDNYNNNKGSIYVERAAARYDFRDGALDGYYIEGSKETDKTYNGCDDQTYHVVLNSDEEPLLDVYLAKMSMVNMNNRYYYLRRVSNNGRPYTEVDGSSNKYQICGDELPWYTAPGSFTEPLGGNYVVDAWAEWKFSTPTSGFAEHFIYPFFNEDGTMDNAIVESDRWYTSKISTVLAGDVMDNVDTWNEKGSYPRYHVWRYLTEGTIPGGRANQQNGISNGVVFKGRIQPAREVKDDSDDRFTKMLLEATVPTENADQTSNPILFMYANHIYCTWEAIRRQAISLAITEIKKVDGKWEFTVNRTSGLYHAVFGNGGFGTITFSEEPDGKINFLNDGNQSITDPQAVANGETVDPTDPNKKLPACPDYLYSKWTDKNDEDANFDAFRKAAVENGDITLYQKSYDPDLGGWAYYCYYYYWNRHNDNGLPGIMGPMEFDVVRNNVYKLAVTKIARLGHPRISANDPDKPTPNTPDEKGDIYITVTCTALPWVVRLNNIEF